nr:hypothetical protein [Kibdelosporangium sp. MJ126-NF4]
MAILKKGSRLLDVDGMTYRWRLRGNPTYMQEMGWSPMYFAVELAEEPGSTLVVETNHAHPSSSMITKAPIRPILPGEVATAIRTALAGGWRPAEHGKQFVLNLSDGFKPDWPQLGLDEGVPGGAG